MDQLALRLRQQGMEQLLPREVAVGGQARAAEGQVVPGFLREAGAGGHGGQQGLAIAPVALVAGIERQGLQCLAGAALGVRVEGAEPLQLVTEGLQAQGLVEVVGPEVHHHAAGAEFPGGGGQLGAAVAQGYKRLQQQLAGHLGALAQFQLLLLEPGGVGQLLAGRERPRDQHLHPALQQAHQGGQALSQHHARRTALAARVGREAWKMGHAPTGQEGLQVLRQNAGLGLAGGIHPEGLGPALAPHPPGQHQGQSRGGHPAEPGSRSPEISRRSSGPQ